MSDAEKRGDDLRAKAALAAAKHAAERAVGDALLTDEERAERVALARRKRTTRVALVAVAALLAVGVLGLMLHYWYWSLLLGLLGVAGLYGRHRLRARRARSDERRIEQGAAARPRARIAQQAEPLDESDASVEDDLAELKARLRR